MLSLFVTLVLGVMGSHPARADASEILAHDRYSLDNGLDVVLHEDHRIPLVAVNLTYHVGSKHDGSYRGVAHLVEHLMFRGTSDLRDGEVGVRLQEAGAIGVNAVTQKGTTSYHYALPSDRLALGLWLESNRMAYMLPAFTEGKFRDEVRTTINEWEEKIRGDRYGASFNALQEALFPVGHPYRFVPPSEIALLQTNHVVDFVRRYHGPANATLVLAGDLPVDVRSLIDHYFGRREGAERPPAPVVTVAERSAEQRIVRQSALATNPMVLLGWTTPGLFEAGDAEADILAATINADRLSAMAEAQAPGMFLDISARQFSYHELSVFMIGAEGSASTDPNSMLATLDVVMDQLRAQPLSAGDVRRARRRFSTGILRGLQRLQGRAGKLQAYIAAGKPPDWLDEDLARYERVDAASVAVFMRDYLSTSRRVVELVVPGADR